VSFGGMSERAFHQLQNMLVRKSIENVLRLSPAFHQPDGVERLETGGYSGELFIFQLRQLRYAYFSVGEPCQQPKPGRVTERAKHGGRIVKLAPGRRRCRSPGWVVVLASAFVLTGHFYSITPMTLGM
jgi:hypothetical protein